METNRTRGVKKKKKKFSSWWNILPRFEWSACVSLFLINVVILLCCNVLALLYNQYIKFKIASAAKEEAANEKGWKLKQTKARAYLIILP